MRHGRTPTDVLTDLLEVVLVRPTAAQPDHDAAATHHHRRRHLDQQQPPGRRLAFAQRVAGGDARSDSASVRVAGQGLHGCIVRRRGRRVGDLPPQPHQQVQRRRVQVQPEVSWPGSDGRSADPSPIAALEFLVAVLALATQCVLVIRRFQAHRCPGPVRDTKRRLVPWAFASALTTTQRGTGHESGLIPEPGEQPLRLVRLVPAAHRFGQQFLALPLQVRHWPTGRRCS